MKSLLDGSWQMPGLLVSHNSMNEKFFDLLAINTYEIFVT